MFMVLSVIICVDFYIFVRNVTAPDPVIGVSVIKVAPDGELIFFDDFSSNGFRRSGIWLNDWGGIGWSGGMIPS